MKRIARWVAAAAILVSASALTVQTAEAVQPSAVRAVHFPTRSWPVPVNIKELIARILAEECHFFPFLCEVVPPATTTTTTSTTSSTSTSTTTTVAPTTTTTQEVTVPPMPSTSTCRVFTFGGGTSQCFQFTSVSSFSG